MILRTIRRSNLHARAPEWDEKLIASYSSRNVFAFWPLISGSLASEVTDIRRDAKVVNFGILRDDRVPLYIGI